MRKVGKYGQEGTFIDENNSVSCANEIYQYLLCHEPIKGWEYRILNHGVPEIMYYEREGADNLGEYEEELRKHRVRTDVPTIILQEKTNPRNFYVVLSGEDKYQATKGNAIERFTKNFNFFHNGMTCNSNINPYVLFCSGCAFFEKDKVSTGRLLESKIRESITIRNGCGNLHVWNRNDEHSSEKHKWNRVYIQYKRFTKEQKLEILMEVALDSVNHYRKKIEG